MSPRTMRIAQCLLIGSALFWPASGWAQAAPGGDVGVSQPLVLMIALAAMALSPFIIMLATSFVKLAVVFALLRNGIGTQQIPPNQIVTGLALILTVYVMMPVGQDAYRAASAVLAKNTNQPFLSQATMKVFLQAADLGKEPVRDFLTQHAHPQEMELFYNMSRELQHDPAMKDAIGKRDFLNIIPAFAVSELTEAFQIGFVLFLPFLVVDLIVANVLLALGMFQVSPVTIALPFKLLLFVLVDGWHLIIQGLVMSYAKP